MYLKASGERSTSVSLQRVSRALGPATFIAATPGVTLVTWTHNPVPAAHHLNHSSTRSMLPVPVVT